MSLVRVAELLAYLCAALAAGGNALANVMQRKASLQEAPDRPFGPRLLLDLVHRPSWLLGFGGLVASFGMQALALGLGPLSAVETIITLELPLILLAASRVFDRRPPRTLRVAQRPGHDRGYGRPGRHPGSAPRQHQRRHAPHLHGGRRKNYASAG